jgi:AAA ATPase domain
MITRIELKNFMSHEHTVIEPAAGLTVLVGPNNVGKSAVVAALQILCTNENSTVVMRHGAKECSVKVVTDEGHEIVWQRRASPSYIINGEKRDRLQRGGVPEELRPALRLGLVESGEKSFDVHFGSQKDPIFLLNGSPGDAAKFFASSSDAHQLVKMQQAHKEKLAFNKKEKARLEDESLKLQKQLTALQPIVMVKVRAEQLEKDYEQVLELDQRLLQLEHTIQQIDQQQRACAHVQQQHAVLVNLKHPPELHAVEQLQECIANLEQAIGISTLLTRQCTALQLLHEVPSLHNIDSLSDEIHERAHWEQKQKRLALEVAVFDNFPAEFMTLQPEKSLESLVEQLQGVSVQHNFSTQQVSVLEPLSLVPVFDNTSAFIEFIAEFATTQNKLKQFEQVQTCVNSLYAWTWDISALEQLQCFQEELQESEKLCLRLESEYNSSLLAAENCVTELRAQLQGMHCPTCHREINANEFLTRAALGLSEHAHE